MAVRQPAARRGLRQRGGAIGRQRVERDVPAIVAQPALRVAAGPRYLRRLAVDLEQDQMIGEPAETEKPMAFWFKQL